MKQRRTVSRVLNPLEEERMLLPQLIILLILIGVALWLINTYIPMDQKIKTILNVVVILIVVIWLLQLFGLWNVAIPVRR
jgi:vacuolar-type H+-ATPase subunit I/STV1